MPYALPIKPMSMNEAWRGGPRYRTATYKAYDAALQLLLPRSLQLPEDGPLDLAMLWNLSNAACDIDNPIKPFVDSLQTRYDFNDKRIYRLLVEKRLVPRGHESIVFDLGPLPV